MKKTFATLLLSALVLQVSATTLFDQLCSYNPNWKKYELRAPVDHERFFASDKELIQTHLQGVLNILRTNSTEGLTPAQLSSRMQLISILDGYRVAGRFPMNYYREERTPVFIDEHHTHCAVGYLLQQTGHEDIALRIAAHDNYIWVKDITDPLVLAWQAQSGLTLEELKLIQGSYDSYIPFAWRLPNKFEVPQKPEVVTRYFDDPEEQQNELPHVPENVWCKGESKNGLLDGKWVQNYSKGLPWIIGYYSQGKRSGQWMEYYQGSTQLCRTENWRNDKLNGVRKRYSREGKLIEEIMFKNGKAITKTNYSLEDSLTYVRKPLDSNLVWTEVYNHGGAMIAMGHERIFNPGNLQWFQNIELTALNTMMLPNPGLVQLTAGSGNVYGNDHYVFSPFPQTSLYNTPPLVQYLKEGDWMYFNEYSYGSTVQYLHLNGFLSRNYRHMAGTLVPLLQPFANMYRMADYDSIKVSYVENDMTDFYGYGKLDMMHLHIDYYDSLDQGQAIFINLYANADYRAPKPIKACGETNGKNERIGEWKCFSQSGEVYKTENYLIAWKDDD